MIFDVESIIVGGSLLVSGGVAFGIVKGSMTAYMKKDDHQKECHMKSTEVYNKLNSVAECVSRIEGYLKAKNGGTL